MKRSGFTMIELIFVIVILGILASVAIPKLAATRDDAKVSKSLSELSTLVGDLGSYYTSQGTFAATDIKSATNVSGITTDTAGSTAATAIADATTYYLQTPTASGTEDCIKFTVTNADGNLTIDQSKASPAGNVCKGLLASSAFKNDLNGTKLFGGSRVSF